MKISMFVAVPTPRHTMKVYQQMCNLMGERHKVHEYNCFKGMCVSPYNPSVSFAGKNLTSRSHLES